LFVTWVSTVIYLSITMQALGTISSVLSRIVMDLVPPAAWAILLMALGGFGSLWIASLRKTTKKKVYSRVRL
jgi:hypothetical protein